MRMMPLVYTAREIETIQLLTSKGLKDLIPLFSCEDAKVGELQRFHE